MLTYLYRMLSGTEAAAGDNIVLVEAADTTELATANAAAGSLGVLAGDQESLYVYDGSTWAKVDKAGTGENGRRYEGIDPYTLLLALKLAKTVERALDGRLDKLEIMTTPGDTVYQGAAVPARLAKGTAGMFLKQGATYPEWANVTAALTTLLDSAGFYAGSTVEAALAEIGAIPVEIPPEAGTIAAGMKYRNSNPTSNEAMGWVCAESGTLGSLVGVTGSITTGEKALTPSALSGLEVGKYVAIAGVSGGKLIESAPAALGSTTVANESASAQKFIAAAAITNFAPGETIEVGRGTANEELLVVDSVGTASTTVDAESLTGQKVLNVASTEGFVVGAQIVIDAAGTPEWGVIASIQDGVSLTLAANLGSTYTDKTVAMKYIKATENLTATHAATETITNCILVDSNADATVDAAAVTYYPPDIRPWGYVNKDWAAWTPALTWGTADPATITTVARYRITDKTVFFNVYIASADGNDASSLTIGLPIAPKDNNSFITPHALQLIDTTWREAMAYIDDGASVIAFYNFGACTDTKACKFIVSGQYEIA